MEQQLVGFLALVGLVTATSAYLVINDFPLHKDNKFTGIPTKQQQQQQPRFEFPLSSSASVGWGLRDAKAPLGRLFSYQISVRAKDDAAAIRVVEHGSSVLPNWLHLSRSIDDQRGGQVVFFLEGVSGSLEKGKRFHIEVSTDARNNSERYLQHGGDEAKFHDSLTHKQEFTNHSTGPEFVEGFKDVFTISVEEDFGGGEREVARGFDTFHPECGADEAAMTATVRMDGEGFYEMTSLQRVSLIKRFSRHLGLPLYLVKLLPDEAEDVEFSGAELLVTGAGKSGELGSGGDGVMLQWDVGCSSVHQTQMPVLEALEVSAKDGTLATAVDRGVTVWHVTKKKKKKERKRKRERRSLPIPATATPMPRHPPPTQRFLPTTVTALDESSISVSPKTRPSFAEPLLSESFMTRQIPSRKQIPSGKQSTRSRFPGKSRFPKETKSKTIIQPSTIPSVAMVTPTVAMVTPTVTMVTLTPTLFFMTSVTDERHLSTGFEVKEGLLNKSDDEVVVDLEPSMTFTVSRSPMATESLSSTKSWNVLESKDGMEVLRKEDKSDYEWKWKEQAEYTVEASSDVEPLPGSRTASSETSTTHEVTATFSTPLTTNDFDVPIVQLTTSGLTEKMVDPLILWNWNKDSDLGVPDEEDMATTSPAAMVTGLQPAAESESSTPSTVVPNSTSACNSFSDLLTCESEIPLRSTTQQSSHQRSKVEEPWQPRPKPGWTSIRPLTKRPKIRTKDRRTTRGPTSVVLSSVTPSGKPKKRLKPKKRTKNPKLRKPFTPNYAPVVLHQLEKIEVLVGSVFSFPIPSDTFLDEDGPTNKLRLLLLTNDASSWSDDHDDFSRIDTLTTVPPNSWVNLNASSQTLYGLATEEQKGRHRFWLAAIDRKKRLTKARFEIRVSRRPFEETVFNHEFLAVLQLDYERVSQDVDIRIDIVKKVAAAFQDQSTDHVTVTGLGKGSVKFHWVNNSALVSPCPVRTLTTLHDRVITPDGRPTTEFIRALHPHRVQAVTFEAQGECQEAMARSNNVWYPRVTVATATANGAGGNEVRRKPKEADDANFLLYILIPMVVLAAGLLLLLVLCILCHGCQGRRKKARALNGIPVIFTEELSTDRPTERPGALRPVLADEVTSPFMLPPTYSQSLPGSRYSTMRSQYKAAEEEGDDDDSSSRLSSDSSEQFSPSSIGRSFPGWPVDCGPPPPYQTRYA